VRIDFLVCRPNVPRSEIQLLNGISTGPIEVRIHFYGKCMRLGSHFALLLVFVKRPPEEELDFWVLENSRGKWEMTSSKHLGHSSEVRSHFYETPRDDTITSNRHF
jgi:hypothetical protein